MTVARYIVGITGASGSIYALRLLQELLAQDHEVHLVVTRNGLKVLGFETGHDGEDFLSGLKESKKGLIIHDVDDLFAPIASGSFKTEGMIIVPCSMSTLGEVCSGVSKNLLGRAADVCIKEGRKLILVPRETPLSAIHLRNMLSLSEMGVIILPAMPAFYHKPESISDMVDFIVGKILENLGIENTLYKKWG